MRARSNHLWSIVIAVALVATPSLAVPTLNVSPGSIAADEADAVQLDVGALAGAAVILRLFTDADGDGVIDPEDYLIWADVVDDDTAPWSPAMFGDTNAATGMVSVGVREFGAFGFPYTAGAFIWEAEDTADASSDTAPFTVTQSGAQSVSGTVTDGTLPVPGAIVLLEPFCDAGDSGRTYSALTDEAGAYSIQLPASVDCSNRLLIAARPGFLSTLIGQPNLQFTGSSSFSENLQITPGTQTATGRFIYEAGPEDGNGVPGLVVTIEGDTDDVAIAFSDENGNFSFTLENGDWSIESPEDRLNSRGAVGLESETNVSVSGATVVPDISVQAANSFFSGSLTDDGGLPLAGREVSAMRRWPCGASCYESFAYTLDDGSYVLSAYVPAGPAEEHTLSVEDPADGLVGEQLSCLDLTAGQTMTGADLAHLAPTSFVSGTLRDKDGMPIGDVCLSGWGGSDPCTGYRISAATACDGTYSLPAVDGSWNIQAQPEDLDAFYRDLDDVRVDRQLTIAGQNEEGVDFVIGRSRTSPTVTFIDPAVGPVGARVALLGYGFSDGGTPQVFFGTTAATIVDFRPDLGALLVEVPAVAPGTQQITVVNTDLGKTSNAFCFEVEPGSPATACSITGNVDDPGAANVQGALVLVYDTDDFIVQIETTDVNGDYSADLAAPGTYLLEIVPPAGQPWSWGTYDVACGGVADHAFAVGSALTGQVTDQSGDGISEALIEAEQTSGGDAFANAVTDEDGFFTMYVPDGGYDVFVEAPSGSRYVEGPLLTPTVSGPTDVGQVALNTGVYFCGDIMDVDGAGVGAEIEAFRRSDNAWSGFADTNTCDGRFDMALPVGEYRLEIIPNDLDVDGPTDVKYVEVQGDTVATFDFVVSERSSVPGGSGPRIADFAPTIDLQVGQPVQIIAVNITGATADVLFSNGSDGFVSGTDIVRDVDRGLIVARVPSGAASGELKIRIDGVDSRPVAYTMTTGSVPAGPFTVSGTVSDLGGPVNGAFVVLQWIDPNSDCDDDDGVLVDYELTAAGGTYSFDHPGGDSFVLALPPTSGTLAAQAQEQLGLAANAIVDFTLVDGVAVDLRVIDDEPGPNPVTGVEVAFGSDAAYDWRVTGTTGTVTLHLPPDDYEIELVPPPDSRLLEGELITTIAGATNLGDQTLARGVMLGSALLRDSDGSAVNQGFVEARRNDAPFDFFFESQLRDDGSYFGPVESGATFNLQVEAESDDVANFEAQGLTAPTRDCILYPAIELGAAGFVDGTVRDAGTTSALAAIHVNTNEDDAGAPGASSGFAQTCDDGTYRLKLAEGDHFVSFYDWQGGVYFPEWNLDASCSDDASSVTVTAGGTTTVDGNLAAGGTISGTITVSTVPTAGASVCTTSATIGSCQFCDTTDGAGTYTLEVPAATDHRIEVFVSGEGTQCYDGVDGCSSFTPVAVGAGGSTSGIDLDFGCSTDDVDGDGVDECGGDCDDTDPNNYPGNVEVCDGFDNDCNAGADFPGETSDGDSDGFLACADCDDVDGTVNPAASELCADGVDNDCNPATVDLFDDDGDGDTCDVDCDDADGTVGPSQSEVCADGVDNDCNPATVDLFDVDGDGDACDVDCDDADGTVGPSQSEVCADGVDNDCNPATADLFDNDGDGDTCDVDCDDADGTVGPSASELCADGVDNDCNPATVDLFDNDGDGDTCDVDCDDADGAVGPSRSEVCADGVDNDCNPATIDLFDGDGDGDACDVDCDDADGTVGPSASELCADGVDNDCNPATADLFDNDGDGDTCDIDCDDADGTVGPSASELCADGVDNDCNPATVDLFDNDGDGDTCDVDCDDADGAVGPSRSEVCADGVDNDCNPATIDLFDGDGDGDACDVDCDDADATVGPSASEVCADGVDNDCNPATPDLSDADGDGFTCDVDCDDADNTTFPGAPEICDGADNDCDTVIPPGESDGDGDGVTVCGGDCDDADAATFPGATEACDGVDNDCDTVVPPGEVDGDGDGFLACNDCDDADATTFPGAAELCDAVDNDCDGSVPVDELDIDSDGFAVCAGDCNDSLNTTYPGAPEICDARDNDCDTVVPPDEIDGDGDGFAICAGDCDDADNATFPGAAEACDGVDNDCDTVVPPGEVDGDGDGFPACNDCDDAASTTFPGATEACDGVDNDCDGSVPANELDADGDGFSACGGDCDDAAATTFPGATEACDGADNDCDGSVPASELDVDGDGFSTCGGDCDDAAATTFPGATEACDGIDNDCDGSVPAVEVDLDGDGFLACTDCDDADATTFPGATEACDGVDNDCDGSVPANELDADGDGFSACGGDCDDAAATTFPGATEACDGADNDCDGSVPASELDVDGDGFSTCGGDCDDAAATTFPGATEACDGIDNDCDGSVPASEVDLDGDGFLACTDCDDADATTFPGATEACDGVDNNCDGSVPANELDADGDGFPACGGDCDDATATTFPGATEACDGADNDCDGSVPASELDVDGDGFSTCGGDCDDSNAASSPGNTEVCDGQDNNCDGAIDEGLSVDGDGDGHYASGSCMAPADDCDDADAANYPGNTEVCDGADNSCDGSVDEGFDADGDGVTTCGGDCDDADAGRYPGNTEACDGLDNDCDGSVPANESDADADGVRVCGGDCDDTTSLIVPGATEVCDGADNNCDGTTDEGFDADTDGVPECSDNCTATANASQADFDLDGIGDACETGTVLADIDRSTRVDGFDLARLAIAFGSSCGQAAYDAESDFDQSCMIDGDDLALLASEFGQSVAP